MEQEMEAMRAQAAEAAEEETDGEDQELDEATQALADVDLNENAIEHGIDIPPSEGAVKDDPNFDAEKSASGLYKVELQHMIQRHILLSPQPTLPFLFVTWTLSSSFSTLP